jgi:hypothetical protein
VKPLNQTKPDRAAKPDRAGGLQTQIRNHTGTPYSDSESHEHTRLDRIEEHQQNIETT